MEFLLYAYLKKMTGQTMLSIFTILLSILQEVFNWNGVERNNWCWFYSLEEIWTGLCHFKQAWHTKIRILQKINCRVIIPFTEAEFFSIALEHFLNDVISKNPVYVYFLESNWSQGAKVVGNFEKIAVGEWEEHFLGSARKSSVPENSIWISSLLTWWQGRGYVCVVLQRAGCGSSSGRDWSCTQYNTMQRIGAGSCLWEITVL